MPEMIDAPKITVTLKTGQKPEADAPLLRFVRWKLVPLTAPVVEPDVQEDGARAALKRAP